MRRILLAVCCVLCAIAVASATPLRLRRPSWSSSLHAHSGGHTNSAREHATGRHTREVARGLPVCSFNGLSGSCQLSSSCNGTSIDNGECGAVADVQCCINQQEATPGCGSAAIQRAMTWVNMQILYCQSANGQPDLDPDCSDVCSRSSNPEWDPYRSDCSGFVSFVYGLPAPGRDTSEFAPYETDISYVISPDELQQGDAINSVPAEHIMLFVRWLADDHSAAELIEEPGCSATPPYARITQSAVVIENGTISVDANGMTFVPIRFDSNTPTC